MDCSVTALEGLTSNIYIFLKGSHTIHCVRFKFTSTAHNITSSSSMEILGELRVKGCVLYVVHFSEGGASNRDLVNL